MKKICKKLTMLGITLSTMMYSTMALAAGEVKTGVNPNEFSMKTETNAANTVKNFGENMLGIVSTAASVLAVIILIILGVKYMMGSAEEKAEYKKTLLPYVIGAVFVFGAGLIASVIFGIAQTNWA